MEKGAIVTIAFGLVGIFFVIFDVYTDGSLAFEYLTDLKFYDWFDHQAGSKFIQECCLAYYPPSVCKDYYEIDSRSNKVRDECDRRVRGHGITPPHHDLNDVITLTVFKVSVGVILAGGLAQTIIAVILSCQPNGGFTTLPYKVKILTIIASLILMGPVVLTGYLIRRCFQGIGEEEIIRLEVLIGALKMGEVMFEAIPQLLVNAATVSLRIAVMFDDGDRTISYSDFYDHLSGFKLMSILKGLPLISYGMTAWLYKKQKPFFISPNYHPWSSFLGILIWMVCGISSYFAIACNIKYFDKPYYYVVMVLGVAFILFIFVFSSACMKTGSGRVLKICTSILYLLYFAAMIALFNMPKDINTMLSYFSTNLLHNSPDLVLIVLASLHLLIGILILPFANLGAKVFAPLVKFVFFVLRKLSCGKFEEKIDELEQWRRWNEVENTNAVDAEMLMRVDQIGHNADKAGMSPPTK